MDRSQLRKLVGVDSDTVLNVLTRRQHVAPHTPLAQALDETRRELGCCPIAVENALRWLNLDGNTPVGRLRRTEIMQLARSVYRFWRHGAAASAASSVTDPATDPAPAQ